jgi:GrpE
VHEAIMRAPSDEVADGTVLQEFRRGFKIGGQLLRPAMVQVRSPQPEVSRRHERESIPMSSHVRRATFTTRGESLATGIVCNGWSSSSVHDTAEAASAWQVSYSEEGTAADADSLAKQAEHAGRDAGDIGEAAATEQSD